MTYAVIGATGKQGGAVVDALLSAGDPVRAIVRDPGKDAARALAARGVELVRGDLDDPDSLLPGLTGITALSMMTTYAGSRGPEGEVEHGMAIADAAARAGVPRVVYSSVGGAERSTGIPHFESKRRIEQHVEKLLPASFVRPTFFMENVPREATGDGYVLRLPLPADVPMQMVAVRDIGMVVAALLRDPSEGAVEIAGDELTGPRIAERIGRGLGVPGRYEALPADVIDDADHRAMFEWFARPPSYAADFAATRRLDPTVWDLETWLTRTRSAR